MRKKRSRSSQRHDTIAAFNKVVGRVTHVRQEVERARDQVSAGRQLSDAEVQALGRKLQAYVAEIKGLTERLTTLGEEALKAQKAFGELVSLVPES